VTITKLIATLHKPWKLKTGKLILEPELIVDVAGAVMATFSSTTTVDGGTVEGDPLESVVVYPAKYDVNDDFVVIAFAFVGIGVGVITPGILVVVTTAGLV